MEQWDGLLDPPADASDPVANMGPKAVNICIGMIVMVVVFVAARIYSRRLANPRWDLADYSLVVGAVGSLALSSLGIVGGLNGLGRHIGVLSVDEIEYLLKVNYAGIIMYGFSLIWIRLSILLLYFSIFAADSKLFRWCAYFIGFCSFAHSGAIIFLGIFACDPVYAAWQFYLPATCITWKTAYFDCSIANIIIDTLILAMPCINITQLNFTKSRKISLIAVFATGGLVVLVTSIRLASVVDFVNLDVTWNYTPIAYWSIAEIAVAVVSVCLPTLKPLLTKLFSKSRGLTKTSNRYNNNNENINLKTNSNTSSKSDREDKTVWRDHDNDFQSNPTMDYLEKRTTMFSTTNESFSSNNKAGNPLSSHPVNYSRPSLSYDTDGVLHRSNTLNSHGGTTAKSMVSVVEVSDQDQDESAWNAAGAFSSPALPSATHSPIERMGSRGSNHSHSHSHPHRGSSRAWRFSGLDDTLESIDDQEEISRPDTSRSHANEAQMEHDRVLSALRIHTGERSNIPDRLMPRSPTGRTMTPTSPVKRTYSPLNY